MHETPLTAAALVVAQAFRLTARLALDPAFLETLRSANLKWDYSVVPFPQA